MTSGVDGWIRLGGELRRARAMGRRRRLRRGVDRDDRRAIRLRGVGGRSTHDPGRVERGREPRLGHALDAARDGERPPAAGAKIRARGWAVP